MPKLIFIDTNIFLDFYRIRGRQGDLSMLKHVNNNHDLIITGSQVEMEFKKNRHSAIRESSDTLKNPTRIATKLPAYLAQSRQASGLDTNRKRIEDQMKTLRARVERILNNPSQHDPVYRVTQRLFRDKTAYNLSRQRKERFTIRRLAFRRFILGYPPRKPGGTSIGDAVNWEWLIHCARESDSDIVIVSRDSDYGQKVNDKLYVNEWLAQEFRDRVKRGRKLLLTDRLTEAFKFASVTVTKKEETAEEKFLLERVAEMGRLLATRSLPSPIDLRAAIESAAAAQSYYMSWARTLAQFIGPLVPKTEDELDEGNT